MKEINFNHNEVVKIINKEQFNEIYHVLRSAKNGVSLEKWLKEYGGYPEFPIYLQYANSGYNESIGYCKDREIDLLQMGYKILLFDEI